MRKNYLFLPLFLFCSCTSSILRAQINCKECGEYYCEPHSEMASGFYIKSDSTFEFYFSYGALDRIGFGIWKKTTTTNGNELLILNSDPAKENPLSVIKKRLKKADQTTLQLLEINPGLSVQFMAFGFIDSDTTYSYFNQQGEAILEGIAYDSLHVFFEYCPDHLLRIPSAKKHNYFELKCDQTLFEIFFRNFSLLISHDKLVGKHPVVEGEFHYFKSN